MANIFYKYRSFYTVPPLTIDGHRVPIVTHRFKLSEATKTELRQMKPQFGFGNFGETVYYRTYSRRIKELTASGLEKQALLRNNFHEKYLFDINNEIIKFSNDPHSLTGAIARVRKEYDDFIMNKLVIDEDYVERQEHWSDTIIRAIEGCFSYRKDHMIKNGLDWKDDEFQAYAREMAISAFKMEWLPPGRGLWAGGTEYTYERGSACLNNCGMTCLENLADSIVWAFDMLMCGCGIGFKLNFNGKIIRPDKTQKEKYVIADNREGWAESAGLLIRSYVPDPDGSVNIFPEFDYSLIRGKGEKLKGFGGESSGPDPLIKFHKRLEVYFDTYLDYQEANTKEERLGCFVKMVRQLRQEDFQWYENDAFNDLERHLRGQPVIASITDLFRHLRWIMYGHFDNEGCEVIVNEINNEDTDLGKIIKLNESLPLITGVRANEIRQACAKEKYLLPFVPFIDALINYKPTDDNNNDVNICQIYQNCMNNAREELKNAAEKRVFDLTYLTANIANATGACVVAGNVRRSSEILGFSPDNQTALNLKDEIIYPERAPISWMSNNSAIFSKTEDFKLIPEITKRVVKKGEPGFYNLLNVNRFGRIGRRTDNKNTEWTREYEMDEAEFVNPCGEIPLCDKELCNLSELIPVRCRNEHDGSFDENKFYKAAEYATFYASSCSLLPSHWSDTNKIIARNRRIGVSITGGADLYDEIGFTELTRVLRSAYRVVRGKNKEYARQAGVPESIRVTTVKPSGTISQLGGVSSGLHFPTFQYSIRRMRSAANAEITDTLHKSGFEYEKDFYSDNTVVFSFPIDQGKTRKASEVTIWEKMRVLETFQREWADNAVSNTIDFDPETEADQLEPALAQSAPMIKTCSYLPRLSKGAYKQMPYEEITREEYIKLNLSSSTIDWSKFGIKSKSDGECPKYCTNDSCIL